MPIKLLLADVDGTLLTHEKVLTTRARAAVAQLGVAGVQFAITSGRPPRGMQMLIQPLALTTPIAAFNGGVVLRPDPPRPGEPAPPTRRLETAVHTNTAPALAHL